MIAKNPLAGGITSVLPGDRGSWVVERILGVKSMGSDRTAVATAAATAEIVNSTSAAFKDKTLFFCSDNAADENMAGRLLGEQLPHLKFMIGDSAHSLMLAIKNGCKGDPEVNVVQAIFLTNKRPQPSVANLLRHSRRFRPSFTEAQQDRAFSVLSHLGWSPQRMTSRARSWSRCALKIDVVLQALALEAENGSQKVAALHNLEMLAQYNRLMIAGMLADLTVEHQACVRQTDTADPDPADLPFQLHKFESRIDLLFMQGHVMKMEHSFTSQISKFLREPSLLLVKKYAILFARPDRTQEDAIFEPLQRMRSSRVVQPDPPMEDTSPR